MNIRLIKAVNQPTVKGFLKLFRQFCFEKPVYAYDNGCFAKYNN
ncbi:hypothetical protein NEIFLAOT_01413 [Neisseria flavescens NRL30031/H210]|uniref:Uncharacterized protein n=1 Tax=Neisseria flavescens NRL30031/H210 TaxID=546264 RepID=C0EN80_NEIFL|nr:hypothetical protein NEIFLAOT_01413 [Neisseria flavescens NRL30031/H210]